MSRRFSRMSAFTSGPQVAPRFLSALAARSADEAVLLQQNGCWDLSPPDLHECDRRRGDVSTKPRAGMTEGGEGERGADPSPPRHRRDTTPRGLRDGGRASGATTRWSQPRTAGQRRSSTGARRPSCRTRISRRGRVSPRARIFVSWGEAGTKIESKCRDGQGGQKKWQKWQKEKRALPGIPTWSPTVVLTGLDRA